VTDARGRVAVDVGGTFIDFVLLDEETGEIVIEKQPSTPARIVEEFMEGLGRLPLGIGVIERLFHGTTVAINTVLQEAGARVGLVTTAGFRDVLAIGRGNRPEIYNFLYRGPEPLVPRYLRREVTERLAADGSELVPLDLGGLAEEVDFLVRSGVEAVAICFLHAYANPSHERAAAEWIRASHPGLAVTASHEVAAEWREYERTSTTVLNAYVQPLFGGYVERLGARLAEAGYRRPLALMQSNGGVISAGRGAEQPIRTLQSGPAGGVIGAQWLARELRYENVICSDVGGTSYDVALIEGGEILERTQTTVARRPIVGPLIDIVSIGAGGGSIAWIDHRGALQVGPQSAGAYPGPACLRLGGVEPTVTDCHLVLGRLDPDNFLGSRMKLDVAAAELAIRERVAEPLMLGLAEAADGILAIAETNMTYAIRTITVERGLDPREFVFFAYGGGGGLFAASVAEELEIPTVVVPRAPANFSAWGILSSDYREDRAVTRVRSFGPESASDVRLTLGELAEQAFAELAAYGFSDAAIDILHRADFRFAGQEYTITVPLEPGWLMDDDALVSGLRERFVAMHIQLYGHGDPAAPIEVVACRVRAIGRVDRPRLTEWTVATAALPKAERSVHFRSFGGSVDTPIYERDTLARGQRIDGPAVVEEWTSTTLVPPGWGGTIDRLGNLVLSRNSGPGA
jgi:N-methylhydantoinase A